MIRLGTMLRTMMPPGKYVDTYGGWAYFCLWDQRRPPYRSDEWIEVVW